MTQANIDFLEANLHHWHTLRDAFYLRSLNANEREGMVRVMREEWFPNYSADLWCGPCVTDMIKLLYRKYEEWKAEQATLIIETVQEPVEMIQFEEPIRVKANFPKHKKKAH